MKTITKELKKNIQAHSNGDYNDWCHMKYDGRRRMFRGINKKEFIEAQTRRIHRIYIRITSEDYKESNLRKAYNYIKEWAKPIHYNYQKVTMYGKTHLYACSPVYGLKDYNKARLLEIKGHEKQCEWLMAVSKKVAQKQ